MLALTCPVTKYTAKLRNSVPLFKINMALDCFDLIGCDFNMETERQRWQKTGLDTKGLGLVGVVNILLRSNHDQAG
jgi:hypothetical protein